MLKSGDYMYFSLYFFWGEGLFYHPKRLASYGFASCVCRQRQRAAGRHSRHVSTRTRLVRSKCLDWRRSTAARTTVPARWRASPSTTTPARASAGRTIMPTTFFDATVRRPSRSTKCLRDVRRLQCALQVVSFPHLCFTTFNFARL